MSKQRGAAIREVSMALDRIVGTDNTRCCVNTRSVMTLYRGYLRNCSITLAPCEKFCCAAATVDLGVPAWCVYHLLHGEYLAGHGRTSAT